MEAKYDFEKKYREQILKCSRCGFCQAVCPVFGATLRPALNARGKMLLLKEVMDGKIELNDELIESLFQCTTCASCVENCPSGVEVPDIIKEARKDMVNIGSCHPAFKGMHQVLQKHTNIYGEDEPEEPPAAKNDRHENHEAKEDGTSLCHRTPNGFARPTPMDHPSSLRTCSKSIVTSQTFRGNGVFATDGESLLACVVGRREASCDFNGRFACIGKQPVYRRDEIFAVRIPQHDSPPKDESQFLNEL